MYFLVFHCNSFLVTYAFGIPDKQLHVAATTEPESTGKRHLAHVRFEQSVCLIYEKI